MTAAGRRLEGDAAALLERISSAAPTDGAALLVSLIEEEDELLAANELKPYEDRVAPLVSALPAEACARVLEQVAAGVRKRALFGSYTRVPDERLAAILAVMDPEAAAEIVAGMSVGLDSPREMARVLGELDPSAWRRLAVHVHPAATIRLLRELAPPDQRRLAGSAGPEAIAGVASVLMASGNRVDEAWAGHLLAALATEERDAALATLPASAHPDARRAAAAPVPVAGERTLAAIRDYLESAPEEEAAATLASVHPALAGPALRGIGPRRGSSLLTRLAEHDAGLAAGLLEACNAQILLRPPRPGEPVAWWLHDCPAAAFLEALDLEHPGSALLLGAIRPESLEPMLHHVSPDRRDRLAAADAAPIGALPLSFDMLGVGRGERRVRRLDDGIRWVHVEERIDTGEVVLPVTTDLLEIPLGGVTLEAQMAVDDARALPAPRVADVFEDYRRNDRRPGEAFAQLGLTQLSPTVRRSGALAAINGNFYFDYGHYINGVTLGIDIASVPGLFFGDPIGWYVAEGRELIPPAFNRAAAIYTDDGRVHIERVFATGVTLSSGRRLSWDVFNEPKRAGRVGAYNSVFGARTEAADTHVDIAIARGRIWELSAAGNQTIPLTGLSLSIPRERARELLEGVMPQDAVTVHNDFPDGRGRVLSAMACGPMLVRDGAIDLDFEVEDFGQQDSSVMSFFLPRWVETYRAARSFMGVRGDTLILGTVSGTAFGWGRQEGSAGMTFGELAQLCVDLDIDHALALDGGGSSSLVARQGGEVRVLNRPTGGADVGPGEERYINTFWLVRSRS